MFLPGEFHGQRSLAGYSPWGHTQSDTAERLGMKVEGNSFSDFTLHYQAIVTKPVWYGHKNRHVDLWNRIENSDIIQPGGGQTGHPGGGDLRAQREKMSNSAKWRRDTMKVEVAQSGPTCCDSMDCPWNSPGQNSGVGSLSLFQGIFPTQGSNPGLPHCRWILYQLSHREAQGYTRAFWKMKGEFPGGPVVKIPTLPL